MRHSLKLLVNTLSYSAKIVVTAVTTIFATRIALEQLGASDFGLYNLIAGIIVMLSFFSGALSISGQRYFSIALGEGNIIKLNDFYNSSLGIHLVIAFILSAFLYIAEPFLFDGFLNILESQRESAIKVYEILILSSLITLMTIPFSAMANAHEDLGILALADIIASILKLIGAFALIFFSDKVVAYAFFMLGSVVMKALLEYIWCHFSYKSIHISFPKLYDSSIWKDMFGFVSWNTLGSLAVVVRNQGIAVLLNIYFGTIVNAAYGVANQVNSLILSFASALTAVFAPTIIRSYGAGDLKMTRFTAILSSKISFFLSSMMALPIIIFLDKIVKIWLDEPPAGTPIFTIYIVICFLILQLYPGLNRAIYATGDIKSYQIILSLLLVGVIPVGALLYFLGAAEYSVLIVLLVSQFMTLVLTIKISGRLLDLDKEGFWKKSVLYPVALFVMFVCAGLILDKTVNLENIFSIIGLSILMVAIYSYAYYRLILNKSEQAKFIGLFDHIMSKCCR